MTIIDANALIVLLEDDDTTSDAFYWGGGEGTLFVSGTPDGATVSLQWANAEADTPRALDDTVALTEAGATNFLLPPGWITAAISSAGASTSLTVEAKRIPS